MSDWDGGNDDLLLRLKKIQDLRYGENPHQTGKLYRDDVPLDMCSVVQATRLHGKEMSFNNILDSDAALECVKQFRDTACVIVKHTSPCGVAIGRTPLEAYQYAYATDPQSAFGGIVAFNRPIDAPTAQVILDTQFVEVIIATGYGIGPETFDVFRTKPSVRVLQVSQPDQPYNKSQYDYKRVNGGWLVQDVDTTVEDDKNCLHVVTKRHPTEDMLTDMKFAWKVAKFVKSNAIVYAKDQMTVGIGAGQPNRYHSSVLGITKANENKLDYYHCVMASDAMFPFPDSVEFAAENDVDGIIQPGGSIKDNDVIRVADEHGLVMVFTGVRHFRH